MWFLPFRRFELHTRDDPRRFAHRLIAVSQDTGDVSWPDQLDEGRLELVYRRGPGRERHSPPVRLEATPDGTGTRVVVRVGFGAFRALWLGFVLLLLVAHGLVVFEFTSLEDLGAPGSPTRSGLGSLAAATFVYAVACWVVGSHARGTREVLELQVGCRSDEGPADACVDRRGEAASLPPADPASDADSR